MNIKEGLVFGLRMVATRLNALSARVENIIAQSGTSDTEVVSARTNGVIGTTGTTLATRLDNDFYALNEGLGELSADVRAATVNGESGEHFASLAARLDGDYREIKEDLNVLSLYESFSMVAKTALIAILRAGVYSTNQSAAITELGTLLGLGLPPLEDITQTYCVIDIKKTRAAIDLKGSILTIS